MEPADDGIRIGTGPGRLEIGQAFFDSRALLSNDFFQLPIDALTDLTVHDLAPDGTGPAAQFIGPGQGLVDPAQGGLLLPQGRISRYQRTQPPRMGMDWASQSVCTLRSTSCEA